MFSDSDPEEEDTQAVEEPRSEGGPSSGGPPPSPLRGGLFSPTGGVLASLRGV